MRDEVVQRNQGRVAVVAPTQQWRRDVGRAGGLQQQLAAQGQELTTELVSFTRAEAPDEAREVLGTADT